MTTPHFMPKEYKAGKDVVSASYENARTQELLRVARLSVGPGLTLTDAAGPHIGLSGGIGMVHGRITGVGTGDNDNAHSWTQVEYVADGATQDVTNGIKGDATASPMVNPAYLMGGGTVDTGEVVAIIRGPAVAGSAGEFIQTWLIFSGAGGGSSGSGKLPARVATTGPLPAHTRTGNVLTASANGSIPAQDGVSMASGDRLLVKDEAAAHLEHGWYDLTDTGDGSSPWVLTRSSDADSDAEMKACVFGFVEEGATQSDTLWLIVTNNPIELNVTEIEFQKYPPDDAAPGLTTTRTVLRTAALDATDLSLGREEHVFTAGKITAVNALGDTDIALTTQVVVTAVSCDSGVLSVTTKTLKFVGSST